MAVLRKENHYLVGKTNCLKEQNNSLRNDALFIANSNSKPNEKNLKSRLIAAEIALGEKTEKIK